MPTTGFFPDAVFGWCFVSLLLLFLLAAAWVDGQFQVIPKWLSLSCLGLGLLGNLLRGAWLGWQDLPVWILPAGAVWGVCDGLLFAAAGFLAGFGLFLCLWLLGVCGGGDVKLFAALGAWTGAGSLIPILAVSVLVVLLIVLAQLTVGVVTGRRFRPTTREQFQKAARRQRPVRGRLPFALPLALAALLVLPWLFRHDLHLLQVENGERISNAR